MNTKTRDEIAAWLLDRVAQGASEEAGSMDWSDFNDGQEEHHVCIMVDEDDEFTVWMSERSFAADFTITSNTTDEELKKLIDEWYDEY